MQFVNRAGWGARAPKGRTFTAVTKVAIHWADVAPVSSHDECAGLLRRIQDDHMFGDRIKKGGGADIGYNLLVCVHGVVFEGRGKGVQCGANGNETVNGSHLAICYLGGPKVPFTPEAKDAINDAADFLGVTDPDWKRHFDFVGTVCPGPDIAEWVAGGHPRASDREEDEMTKEDRDTLKFIAQVLGEMKSFYGRFDPTGNGDFFRGMDEAARLIKQAAA